MFILIFLIPIFLIFGAIYWYDSSNESKIDEYLQKNNCKNIYLYKSKYNTLCEDKLIRINDYFILNFESNEEIIYSEIKSISNEENLLLIETQNTSVKIEFEDNKNRDIFEKNLNRKLNK